MLNLSEKIIYLPGKSNKESNTWLPTCIHAVDTTNTICYLFDNWLSEQSKRAMLADYSSGDLKNILIFLALTHDIGKMTPAFVRKILPNCPAYIETCLAEAGLAIPEKEFFGADFLSSPHALASESILLNNGISESLATIAGAHHGKPQSFGTLKIKNQTEIYFKNYFGFFDSGNIWNKVWNEYITFALDLSELSPKNMPHLSETNQMLLSGLVSMADWIASNTHYFPLLSSAENIRNVNTEERIKNAIVKLNLTPPWTTVGTYISDDRFEHDFEFAENPMQESVISKISNCENPGLVIIEAPMGSGKTEAALAAAEIINAKKQCGGLFYGLPTQATTNAMFSRLGAWAKKQAERSGDSAYSIKIIHSMAELDNSYEDIFGGKSDVNNEESDNDLIVHSYFRGNKLSLMSDFAIGTIDQSLMMSLKQSYTMLRHVALSNKVVILDEVHSYDAYMNQYLETTLNWLGEYNIPVIMLSATLPNEKREAFVNAYLGSKTNCCLDTTSYPLLTWTDAKEVHQADLPTEDRQSLQVSIKRYDDSDVAETLKTALKGGGCAGVILNTVRRAQEMTETLKEQLPDKKVILIHSGFTMADRHEIEEDILSHIGRSSKSEDRDNLIIVGTQILEQSLDIDFDFLITDLCPMDFLLQRLGRLHRHSRNRPDALKPATCIVLGACEDIDKGSEAVYGKWLLLKTKELLPDKIILPDSISYLVKKTYENVDDISSLKSIELKESYEKYQIGIKQSKMDAMAFCIAKPNNSNRHKNTIHGLLDADIKGVNCSDTMFDVKSKMSVRDCAPSMRVIVMVQYDNGDIGYLPWVHNAECVPTDREPIEDDAREIAKQNLTLPHILCNASNIDKTINILDKLKKEYFSEWSKSPILNDNFFLLLNEDLYAAVGDYQIEYDRQYGLKYKKVG